MGAARICFGGVGLATGSPDGLGDRVSPCAPPGDQVAASVGTVRINAFPLSSPRCGGSTYSTRDLSPEPRPKNSPDRVHFVPPNGVVGAQMAVRSIGARRIRPVPT